MQAEPARPHRRRFEPWPWVVVGLLAAMIGSSLCLLKIASAHPDGLVVHDAWDASLAYNQNVAALKAARAEGLALHVVTRPSPGGVRVEAAVRADDRTGAHAPDADALQLRVRRLRPAEAGYDADFPLAPDGDGFSGDVPLPLAGRWHLLVTATRGDAVLSEQVDLFQPTRPALQTATVR